MYVTKQGLPEIQLLIYTKKKRQGWTTTQWKSYARCSGVQWGSCLSMIWNKDTRYPGFYQKEKFAGIYSLRNLENGKVYVGKTGACHDRLMTHYYSLKRGTHPNKELQKDFDGGDSFEVKILCRFEANYKQHVEECALEAYFILKNEAVENGHNKNYNYIKRCDAERTVLEKEDYIKKQCGIEDVMEYRP